MIYRLYNLATRLGRPAIEWLLYRRMKRGKEDPARFAERKGVASHPRPSGTLIWFHGASVGEAQALLPLIERITSTGQASVLLTTGTVTSAKLLTERLPAKAIHQFVPVDHPDWVRAFMDHWQPDLALWSESDFWPNLLELTHERGIPMVLLQGRVSPQSFIQWLKIPTFIGGILSHFDLCLAQTPGDADRLTRLGAHGVVYVGNLKLTVPPLPADPAQVAALSESLAGRPVWIAASTHPGEEKIAAQTHQALKVKYPNLLTIIIPRHPARATQIMQDLTAMGLHVAVRSQHPVINPQNDVYLVDTIGEMGLFFRLSPIVFMGKSLTAEGGQNPFEPARLGAAILFGPRMSNFEEMCIAILAAKGAVVVADGPELTAQLDRLLGDAALLAAACKASHDWAESEAGILERFVRTLKPFLDRLNVRP